MTNLRALIVLPILLILLIVTFFIQLKLAKQKSKWPGLIFPIFFTLIAAFLAFGATIYTGDIISLLLTFVVYLIPAIIHLLIYVIIRNNQHHKHQQEIDKMKIQDL